MNMRESLLMIKKSDDVMKDTVAAIFRVNYNLRWSYTARTEYS
jgi:hypothetical protein